MQFTALFLLSLLFNIVTCYHEQINKKNTNGIAVIGYIHGNKLRPNTALELPGFLISPVIIVPTFQQRVVMQINDKQVSIPVITNNNNMNQDYNDLEVTFRQALDKGNSNKRQVKVNKTLELVEKVISDDNTTKEEEITTLATDSNTEVTTEEIKTTTGLNPPTSNEAHAHYPDAHYNNQYVNSVTVTIKPPDEVLYPPLMEDKWSNFSDISNMKKIKENKTISNTLNAIKFPSEHETNSPIKGIYPAALYNNTEIDKLSITTNSNTNGSPLPPPQDDRWRSFSSLRKMLPTSSEFKPLAGLYYDGFLHKPVQKAPGFLPYNHYRVFK